MMTTAMLVSAGFHLGILFGIQKSAPPPPKKVETEMIQLTIMPPNLKELEEEPDPTPSDNATPLDLSIPVPMQADLPAIARPEDFVQALDFSSLLEKPDLSQTKISVIPEHIRRGVDLREKIGVIFNIADLDRSPEPIVQQAPIFPFNLKREAIEGRVRVEFVVDTEGKVHNPFVVESTHPGFEEAAMIGVSRWKFRPGMKNGRKVNTRMQVPIVFKIVDDMD
jgi:protein TonB